MRLALALILTIFIAGPVLSINPALRTHHSRDGPPNPINSTSQSITTTTSSIPSPSSSLATITTTSSSLNNPSSSFTPSTSTSPTSSFSSSSESPSSTFSSSSTSSLSPSVSTQEPSSSQGTTSTSTSQSTQIFSTSSSVASDTTSTSLSLQTRTTFTSTGTDGSLFTVTAVISSPSGGSGSGPINTAKQGFFANTGAVAGTFLVVGLVGTGIFICVFLSALRRYRRHKRNQAYLDEDYKEFNQLHERAGTPDATLPDITRESRSETPVSSTQTPNMIERLHGSQAIIPNASYDTSQYQAQPGEFDPYQNHGGGYAYSDDQVVYEQHPGNNQPGNTAYAYQPGTESNNSTGHFQAVAEPLHVPQGAMVPHTR